MTKVTPTRSSTTKNLGNALQFKIGDKVVYPNHGVGIIEDITRKNIAGTEKMFYCLRIQSTDSTVMVPISNIETVGLRKVLSKREINRVLEVLKERKVDIVEDWKGRYQINSDLMRSGEIDKVAEVLKSLSYLSLQKSLSYRERKMLDKAKFLIVSELVEATHLPEEKIEEQIDKAISFSVKSKLDH
ncbi:MAG: CarD family transcriptional regulator [Acidobacteriota bacterium]